MTESVYFLRLRIHSVQLLLISLRNGQIVRELRLSHRKKALIRQQYANYRSYRQQLPQALPFWPLGLAREGDPWICLGMEFPDCLRLALWRLGGADTVHLPLPQFRGKDLCPKVAFPANDTGCRLTWNPDTAILTATLPEPTMARLIEIPIQPLTE